jgi:hypothetical protein
MSQIGQFGGGGGGGNNPNLPAFFAYQTGNTGVVTGDGTIYTMGTDAAGAFTIVKDQANNLTGAGGSTALTMTAHTGGLYYFVFAFEFSNLAIPTISWTTSIVTTQFTYNQNTAYPMDNSGGGGIFSALAPMNIGDTAIFQTSTNVGGAFTTSITGFLSGPYTYIAGWKVA